jgi:beta-mannosidase
MVNGKEIAIFCGTNVPHTFDLTPHLKEAGNRISIVFDLPPRWLGQFGYTCQVKEWKTRFNYAWDWQPRFVQIGIWDDILLEVSNGAEFGEVRCTTDSDVTSGTGTLRVTGDVLGAEGTTVQANLTQGEKTLRSESLSLATFKAEGLTWCDLSVSLWNPNGHGEQPLYTLTLTLQNAKGEEQDRVTRRVGFRNIVWRACENAPEGADPWLCVINGKPVFLQGVNCPPMLPNFADTPYETYRQHLTLYKELGVNTLRVNGVGFLEKTAFYDLCDELGLMIWQDVPLSSSGIDNVPPADPESVRSVGEILQSFILRRQHHASLLLWCGGNELHERHPDGYGVPMTTAHPLIGHLDSIVSTQDPLRRFLPTTATGPRFNADAKDFGKGIHWNVHGPWKMWGSMEEWETYWRADDSLFRAETGAPGAAPSAIIYAYAGDFDPMPVTETNPVWRRPLTWWIEEEAFTKENGHAPQSVEEYVVWSQQRQATALSIAVQTCKDRFPQIGGILLWCGHDCYPCSANTSIIDLHGEPKPAALALQKIWKTPAKGETRHGS